MLFIWYAVSVISNAIRRASGLVVVKARHYLSVLPSSVDKHAAVSEAVHIYMDRQSWLLCKYVLSYKTLLLSKCVLVVFVFIA